MNKNNKAFTLVELLVVVLIIGILAAIAVPQYQKATTKSRFAKLKPLINSIVQAEEVFYMTHNDYTAKFSELDISMPNDGQFEEDEGYNAAGVEYEKIVYDWGFCILTKYHTVCSDTKINMKLDFYYSGDLSPHTPGAHICTVMNAVDENDYRNQLCKQETGAETSNVSGKSTYWHYVN